MQRGPAEVRTPNTAKSDRLQYDCVIAQQYSFATVSLCLHFRKENFEACFKIVTISHFLFFLIAKP
jgi:hypothetical protein